MLIDDVDAVFDVPDDMIREFYIKFQAHLKNHERDMICSSRDSSFLVIESLREDKEKLSNPFYVNSFIRALAMREALKKLGVLYDA